MKLTVNVEIAAEEEQRLSKVIAKDSNKYEDTLALYASAAIEEYIHMFLGQRVYTRGSDIREYRLFLLIQRAFNNRIPEEQLVSDLFQTTRSQSKLLLRAVLSKFQFDLRDAVKNSLADIIKGAEPDENKRHHIIRTSSELLVEEMNQVLASYEGNFEAIRRKARLLGVWEVKATSYDKLREHFGL